MPPLRGAHGFKEAGAYVTSGCRRRNFKLGDKLHRFPYVEPDEPFISGDGTVRGIEEAEEEEEDEHWAIIAFELTC